MTEDQRRFVRSVGGFMIGWAGVGLIYPPAHYRSDLPILLLGIAIFLFGFIKIAPMEK